MAAKKTAKKSVKKKGDTTDLSGLSAPSKPPVSNTVPEPDTDKSGWFQKGQKGFDTKRKIDLMTEKAREKGVFRYSLKAQEEGVVVFIDDPTFFIWEHNVNIGGRWGNYITCLKDYMTCPVCQTGLKSTYTAYGTVIDTRKFTRGDGSVSENRKILYPAKGTTIRRLEELQKKHGTLVGRAFKVKRFSKDDPNCGTDFEYIKAISLAGEFKTPHDYEKVLAPYTMDELLNLGYQSKVVGSAADVKPSKEGGEVLSDLKSLL